MTNCLSSLDMRPLKPLVYIPIIPIFKKGCKTKIENYRPIANLCSSSKIFEKLILKQIQYLQSKNKLDLTGKGNTDLKK